MRSRKHKGKKVAAQRKQKGAYRRGEKVLIFLRRGIAVLLACVCVLALVFVGKLAVRSFLIKDVLVSGNYHLDEDAIVHAADIRNGESLVKISFSDIESRIGSIGWVKHMSLKKRFPDTLMIDVEEAEPSALLSFKRSLFLTDSDGRIIEKISGDSMPFLPVIKEVDPVNDRGGVLEALKLIEILDEENILAGKESIELLFQPYGPLLKMDGETVKVGYGEYREKILRWKEIEPEIEKKSLAIDYVDLRFKDKVIVRPLKKK